jgi:hypothetical protein
VDRVLHGGLQGAPPVRGPRLTVGNDGLVRETNQACFSTILLIAWSSVFTAWLHMV